MPAAPFKNVHLAAGWNKLCKENWRSWVLLYVDDAMPYSLENGQGEAMQRIFGVAMQVLGKELSTKVDNSITEEGHIAGLGYVHGGVALNTEGVEAVKAALQEVEEKKQMGEKGARRLVGILIYAASTFEWDTKDQTWWARTTEPLSDSYKGASFKWSEECCQSVKALKERVAIAPRKTCHPAEMMRQGWRLVVKSDGCNTGVGACLLLVKAAEDGSVTPAMMSDPSSMSLLATDSKVLSDVERKWLTFEVECYGMYRAFRKWAGVLMRVDQLDEQQ